MPCSKCGHSLVTYYEEIKCPKCDGLVHLDPITAIELWEQRLQYFNDLYNQELAKWDVDLLLVNILALRENSARNYIKEYGPLELGKFATYTILLDRVMRFSVYSGNVPQQNDVGEIINHFEALFRLEDQLLRLRSCYADVLRLTSIKLDEIDIHDNLDSFMYVENDRYDFLRKTFTIYDIYSEKDSKEIMERYKAEDESISKKRMEYRHFEPPEFIITNFRILNAMYSLFLRNRSHAEVFGRLRDYRRLMESPNDLMEFIWKFRLFHEDVQTFCPTNEFVRRAVQFFNESKEKVRDVLIHEKYNKSIFPLFVRVNVKGPGDSVFISHRFSFLIHTFLHAILTENLFNKETAKRSLEFERDQVKEMFEKYNFNYISNVVDKKNRSLEIDGLAIKGNSCYVVECKGWRLGKFIDEKENRDRTIRDLKGIVLGEKYTTKNQTLVIEKKPSLKEKADYIKNNYNLYFQKDNNGLETRGLIVTIGYPPIKEFRGIEMISIEEIPRLS